jgi:hypothetical protein
MIVYHIVVQLLLGYYQKKSGAPTPSDADLYSYIQSQQFPNITNTIPIGVNLYKFENKFD